MLQFIQDYFGLQQEPYDETPPDVPPRILVTVITSSDAMSKSDPASFSITLHAVVDGDRPVTVDVFHTILWRRFPALNQQGFTFTDTSTHMSARRPDLNIQYDVSSYLEVRHESLVEIPTSMTGVPPYEVCFEIHKGRSIPDSGDDHDLHSGHGYEIGLGPKGPKDEISWWKMGSKAQVFAAPNEKRGRHLDADVPKLRMMLTNKTTFKVVD